RVGWQPCVPVLWCTHRPMGGSDTVTPRMPLRLLTFFSLLALVLVACGGTEGAPVMKIDATDSIPSAPSQEIDFQRMQRGFYASTTANRWTDYAISLASCTRPGGSTRTCRARRAGARTTT